jgi:hypothetical protein
MTTTSYNIQELKIFIRSNILKNNDSEYDNFEFTKDNLYLQDQKKFNKPLNTYPYFTSDIGYPRDKLLSLSMRKRIEFFFNLDQYMLFITTYGEKNKEKNEITNNNINIMLELLFPTQFPIHNDIKDSHSYYLSGNRGISNQMLSMITNPFENKYSYIRHNGKIYTTRRVIWVNDMLNHSIYKKLIDLYATRLTQGQGSTRNTVSLTNDINNIIRSIVKGSNTSISYISLNTQFQDRIDALNKKENKLLSNIYAKFINKNIQDEEEDEGQDKDDTQLIKNIETSVLQQQTSSKSYYYIELSIDYFQGEINSENKHKFICNFTSNHLGNLFEKIVQSKEIDKYKQKWNVDLDKAPLYQSDVPIVTKRNNDMKLEDSKRDVKDESQGQIMLFSDIIQNGNNTKKYIEHINKEQGLSIEINQLYEDAYLDTIRENKYSDVVKKLYELLNQEGDTNPIFIRDNINKIKKSQKIKIPDNKKTNYESDPIKTIVEIVDDDPTRIFMYFFMEDIINYMSIKGLIRDSDKNGGSRLKTRKNKKSRIKNATIKKN